MIKRLAKCVREYKVTALLTPLFIIFEVLLEVLMPFLTAHLVDYGIELGHMPTILKTGGLLVLCAVASLACGVLAGATASKASAGFAKNLREDMFYNVQNFSFANIDKFSGAGLITRMTTDVTNVQNSFQMIIRMAIRAPFTVVFAMVMAFSINARVSLIFLAILPVLGIGLYLIMGGAHPIFKRTFKIYDKLNTVIQENLRGIRVVKSFVREQYEEKKFKGISSEIYNNFAKAEKLLAFNNPLMQTCVYTTMLLISFIGAKLIIASGNDPELGMTTGKLMSLISYVMQILMSFMMVSMIFVMLTISRASAERIVEVLDEKSDITDPDEPVESVADGSIRFEGVGFGYSKKSAVYCLEGVDLDIRSGETIGIIGGTGSSKSTLVQLIPRLYDVSEGRVLVGGVDVRSYRTSVLRDAVAVVLQKNLLFSGTIKDNLRWGNENADDAELERVCKLACADEFIKTFPDGYDTYIEQGGTNVSGGQKQRLCIARALLKKPKILILDDSTSAVDTHTDRMIRNAFKNEIPDTTKLIIAQRISSVEHADRIIVLEGGRINAVGTHSELLASNEIYKEIYYSQNKEVAGK